MADAEILRSIDRTLERIDGHMERGNLHMERGNTLFEENRWFTRDLVRRQEKFMKGVMEELARQGAATNELRAAIGRDHREIVDELRAGRDAMFRMLDRLDRLDGGDAPASA
jgi:hypothetical protein